MTIENLFYKGQFLVIIQDFEETYQKSPLDLHMKKTKNNKQIKKAEVVENVYFSNEDLNFILGSYCFAGQLKKAEDLFHQYYKQLCNPLSLFFLVIGWTRLAEYGKAREYLLQLKDQSSSQFDKYLFCQSMSFYSYFICRYKMAERWIDKTQYYLGHEYKNTFWALITNDLKSHILIKRGSIHLGLNLVLDTKRLAKKLEHKFTEEAITVSEAIYQSQFNIDQENTLLRIKKLVNLYSRKSHYFYFGLVLEYSRRLNLRGDFLKSEKMLRFIEKKIFVTEMSRYKGMWCFRFSHLLFLQGRITQALSYLNQGVSFLDNKQDLNLLIQLLGLKLKIHKILKLNTDDLEARIKKITFYCQDSQSLSYAYRYGWIQKPVTEDPFAPFFHSWVSQGTQNVLLVKKVIEKNWSSLFIDLLPLNRINFILLEVLPKTALFFNQNQIFKLNAMTPLMNQSLKILSQTSLSKREFVKQLWGYDYDSHRHDSLIYTLVGRLREALGECHHFLILKNHTLELVQTQVVEFSFETHLSKLSNRFDFSKSLELQESAFENLPHRQKLQLNSRQILILEYLETHRFVGAREMSEFLQVPQITACRDLTDLVDKNFIIKVGRARATQYSRGEFHVSKISKP